MTADKTFFREHYPWDRTVTYRLADGTFEYHYFQCLGNDKGRILVLSWAELKPILLDEWRPVSQADRQVHHDIARGDWG